MSGNIERRSIAAQLAERIETEIRSSVWQTELPGKRTLADRYGVNVKTCASSLDLLEQRGFVGPAHAGKGRAILPLPPAKHHTDAEHSNQRLLVIQPVVVLNIEDFNLLRGMVDAWQRLHGPAMWARVDFFRCKQSGRMLDSLLKRHAPDALLLCTPGPGWTRQAARRLPLYQSGGSYDTDVRISMSACSIYLEIKRLAEFLRTRGHHRILIPTEAMPEPLRQAVINGLREGVGGKPDTGTWEDYCPQFPESVPDVWDAYWKKAFARLRPTAVIVHDDTHLLSLYGYCLMHGVRIPADLSVIAFNYEPRFEWLRPRPTMARYPASLAIAHFQQWLDGGLKPIGNKIFPLEIVEGESVAQVKV